MRTQIPEVPAARSGDRRGSGLRARPRRRVPRAASAIDSLEALLAEGWDAVFVGSGAPRGRDLDVPGPQGSRGQHPHRHRLAVERVVRPHRRRSASASSCWAAATRRWTAAAASRRLGGEDVQVVVRSGFDEMKASPWEKEDAMHEGIPIHNFLVPKAFTHDDGKLTGVTFEKVAPQHDAKGRRQARADRRARRPLPVRRRAGRDRPGERVSVDRARHRHRVRRMGHAGRRQGRRWRRRAPACSSAATPRSAPRTSSGRSRTATTRRSRSTCTAAARTSRKRPPPHVNLIVAEDGHPRVELRQRDHADKRYRVPLKDTVIALAEHPRRGRAGLRPEARATPRRSAASTATCRRCSPTSCASSATPASTSARWTASRSPQNGDEAELRAAAAARRR